MKTAFSGGNFSEITSQRFVGLHTTRTGTWLQISQGDEFIMNDLVIHQQVTELAGVSVGLVHQEEGSSQYLPKFSIGDEVVWAYVKAHDYGIVVDRLWTAQSVHKVTGWHYRVRLHPNSSSYPFCKEDWAFEKDLELLDEFNSKRRPVP